MPAIELIDHIYEAAFLPDHWESVCERLSGEVDSFSTSLITIDANQSYRWTCSRNAREGMESFSRSPLRFQNIRPQRHMQRAPSSFMRDVDLMTLEELDADPIYNEFLRPRGLGWTVGDMFQEPSGLAVIFDLIRQTDKGPFEVTHVERLNMLRPHLARAALMSSRLQFERITAMVQSLQLIGLPAAVIADSGKVLAANDLLQAFAPQIVITAFDRLVFESPGAKAKFNDMVSHQTGGIDGGCSFALPSSQNRSPAVVHVIPVRGQARDFFLHANHVLIVTPLDRTRVPSAETIQGLFDLTPAEARVARSLASGRDVSGTAQDFSLSPQTVRSHVRSILAKSAMTRQTDFVAAVASLGPIGAGGDEG